MATIIVLIVLAVILFFFGRSFIRDRKNGGCSGCPGGCPGCGGGKSCHVKSSCLCPPASAGGFLAIWKYA